MRIGILGYGNLGRGVECAIKQNQDMELVAVFTRRAPESVSILTETATVCSVADVEQWKDKIDVMILCGGSATDLPEQTPKYAQLFNVVDSFDTHARIPEHFENVDVAAKKSGHVGIISVGLDPGMFSLNRLYANAILPEGRDYTFWGKGVSQGHSDAIRERWKAVYNSGRSSTGSSEKWRKSRAYYKTEAYERMLCCFGGRCRCCKGRGNNQKYAKLFCRL